MNLPIVIKTNSAYSYLWPIIKDFCSKFPDLKIIIDEGSDFDFGENSEKFYYDPNLNYTKRLLGSLKNIKSDYILLIHDVDLILNLDSNKLISYLELVKEKKVERLSLGVYNQGEVVGYKDVSICRLVPGSSKNFFTPFDYSPSIYYRKSFMDFLSVFEDESYQNLELNPKAQEWIINNMNCFGIFKDPRISCVYHRGFVFSSDLNFLHITVKGKFLPSIYYYDLEDKFKDIVEKYGLLHIEINNQSPFIDKNTL